MGRARTVRLCRFDRVHGVREPAAKIPLLQHRACSQECAARNSPPCSRSVRFHLRVTRKGTRHRQRQSESESETAGQAANKQATRDCCHVPTPCCCHGASHAIAGSLTFVHIGDDVINAPLIDAELRQALHQLVTGDHAVTCSTAHVCSYGSPVICKVKPTSSFDGAKPGCTAQARPSRPSG